MLANLSCHQKILKNIYHVLLCGGAEYQHTKKNAYIKQGSLDSSPVEVNRIF